MISPQLIARAILGNITLARLNYFVVIALAAFALKATALLNVTVSPTLAELVMLFVAVYNVPLIVSCNVIAVANCEAGISRAP